MRPSRVAEMAPRHACLRRFGLEKSRLGPLRSAPACSVFCFPGLLLEVVLKALRENTFRTGQKDRENPTELAFMARQGI